MISEQEYEIEQICLKVIQDHLLYHACPQTYSIISTQPSQSLDLRYKIINYIISYKSHEALKLITDVELMKLLKKQSFLEQVKVNNIDEALKIADEYLRKYENDEIFSVLGYEDLDNEEVKEYFEVDAPKKLAQKVNRKLFMIEKKRNVSLLMIAWFHYKSIQMHLNK